MAARFTNILIANRGEIACRIIRAARAEGYRAIAVFSDADAEALHVREADCAVNIGPAAPAQSYLSAERVLDAARKSGAQAVHPGYGFLSENAGFAERCLAAGLVFIGPTPAAMRAMGDKSAAKARMIAAGVPCAPGYHGEDQADQRFAAEAARLGFPVMVKASAGGGGRGMRLVRAPEELDAALHSARAEAASAFGDGRLLLERALIDARHVEVQVFGDEHGAIVHLGERDCSIQRRHQKVIEEAPSPAVSPQLRERMGAAAVQAARAVGYVGAGTVEFLLGDDGAFYFLEMNTRIQSNIPSPNV
jgi:geranyl-CoA carboxylase alpha subunit